MNIKQALAALVIATGVATAAQAEVKIGVITSSTGPIALVGIPQKNSVPLMPTEAGGQKIRYILLDDGSDPTATVTAVNKLINEEKVDAIVGPSGTPGAVAAIPFVAEAGVPLLAPVGSSAVVLPMTEQKKWVFKTTQNDEIIADALFAHMARHGVKTLGYIGTADAYGENWLRVAEEEAAKHDIEIVAKESFQRRDTSVTGQALKIIARRPDAVLVGAPGSSTVMPHTTLVEQRYRGQIYQTHGAALDPFLKLGGDKVEGTILAAGLLLVLDEMPDSHPSKRVATDYVQAYEKLYGERPATFGANVYDAGLLLARAIPAALEKGEPGSREFRAALRDELEATSEFAATQGVYNMTPEDHSGFDERGRELITVKNGRWALVKD